MRKILGLIGGLLSPLAFAAPVFAATTPINLCPEGDNTSGLIKLCALNFDDVPGLIRSLITIILIAAIVIALFFLIYGGIKWIISGGDKTAVESARNHIVAAIVGLLIALLAFFILNLVGGLFGLSLTNLQIPTLIQGQ